MKATTNHLFQVFQVSIGSLIIVLINSFKLVIIGWLNQTVWPVKTRQMSIKVAQKDFTRKIQAFDTFTKTA